MSHAEHSYSDIPSDGELRPEDAKFLAEIDGIPYDNPEPQPYDYDVDLPLSEFNEAIEPTQRDPIRGRRSAAAIVWTVVIAFMLMCGAAIMAGTNSPDFDQDSVESIPTIVPSPSLDPTSVFLRTNSAFKPVIETIDGVEMVLVPARCESEEQCFTDSFWIDRYEVTNQQAGNTGQGIFPEHPYVDVTLDEAQHHCSERGGRLPTADEWEFAAGGVEQWLYPWGNRFDGANVNFCDRQCDLENRDERYNDGYKTIAKVSRFNSGASWVGAVHLSGNVAEWTFSEDTTGSLQELRGGSWASSRENVTTNRGEWVDPSHHDDRTGFRCLIDSINQE